MPTTYAHYKFGDEIVNSLPNNLKEIINKNREVFDIGVHGPDIFFYYKFLNKNDVSDFGFGMHRLGAKPFFEKCKEVYNSHDEKAAMLSYMLGFLTHFTFDSTAHGYVDRKKEVSLISHNRIESQYDQHLMKLDGLNPVKNNRTSSIVPSEKSARIISYFFDFDEKVVLETIKGLKLVVGVLLYAPLSIERKFKYELLKKIMPKDNDFKDIIVVDKEDEECKDSNIRLDKLKKQAFDLYPLLLNNFLNYLNNKEELNDYFNHNFEVWPDYKNIPILSYEEELNYTIEPIKI